MTDHKNETVTTVKKWSDILRRGDVKGALAGGGIGAVIGSSMGVAALGTAVSGLLPVAAVGATVGFLAVRAFSPRK